MAETSIPDLPANRPFPWSYLLPEEEPFDLWDSEAIELRMDAGFYALAEKALAQHSSEAVGTRQRYEAGASCIVFCAMTLEAYVNRQYELSRLPSTYDNGKPWSVWKKWKELPKSLGAVNGFADNEEPWLAFKALFEARNNLAHFKPKEWRVVDGLVIDDGKDLRALGNAEYLRRLFNAIEQMIRKLSGLVGDDPEGPGFGPPFEKVEPFRVLQGGLFRKTVTTRGSINPRRAVCHQCGAPITTRGIIHSKSPGDPLRYFNCRSCYHERVPHAPLSVTEDREDE